MCDLRHALTSSMELGPGQQILVQICRGLAYVHGEGIMHRDLKPSNILLQKCPGGTFVAKVADFGLARRVPQMHDTDHAPRDDDGMAGHWQHKPTVTTQVTTLWYRAPEVLLASTQYGTGVDMWSCGCLGVEALTKSVAFPGSSEHQMLINSFSFAGTHRSDEWPSLLQLPQFRTFLQSNKMQSKGLHWPKLAADTRTFLVAMLRPCPSQRWPAQTALKDKFLLATGSDVVDEGENKAEE